MYRGAPVVPDLGCREVLACVKGRLVRDCCYSAATRRELVCDIAAGLRPHARDATRPLAVLEPT